MNPKIAVVDLLLAYPPAGGAGVDLFNNFSRLSARFDVRIFGITFQKYPEKAPHDFKRGIIESTPPAECTLIPLSASDGRAQIVEKIFTAVSEWNPALVYIADGWTLKPYVTDRFSGAFKTIVRLYAYEMLCPRNNQKWLFTEKCGNNALENCGRCLECTKEYAEIVRKHRNGGDNPLTFEAALADIWSGDYCEVLSRIVNRCHFIVYNSATASLLRAHGCLSVTKIPGAVDIADFKPDTKKRGGGVFNILVCGRMDDRAKGASTAIEAGLILRQAGLDVRMTVTSQKHHDYEWLTETGWQSKEQVIRLLEKADCALVPSLWDEAFGMTWVEAAAMKVPVVASRIGGPAEYIQDGVTGLLAEPGNPEDFAAKIMMLYNDENLRKSLMENGREAVEKDFNWDITSKMTEELIERVISGNADR